MKINNIQNSYLDQKNKIPKVSFGNGLPGWFIVDSMIVNIDDVEKELLRKGLKADFANSKVVALCCKKTVEIMENYGFKIPKEFKIENMNKKIRGVHDSDFNRVSLNSNNKEFFNVFDLDQSEEIDSFWGYSENSGHFLQTYLHEFSHAAHYGNLCSNWNNKEANKIYEKLNNYEPNNIMLSFLYGVSQKMCMHQEFLKNILKFFIPPKNGQYAKTNVAEYLVEKNTRLIAKDLGYNLTLKNKNQPPIINPQNYYSLFEEFLSKINLPFVQDLLDLTSKYDRAIWDGELEKLAPLKKNFDQIIKHK